MDTIYDPEKFQTVKLEFLSKEYFNFLENKPALASALALGERVLIVADGKAYEIVMGESSAGEIPWLPIPDGESQYSQPSPENFESQIDRAVAEASQIDTTIAIQGNSSGGKCVYGLFPQALISLIFLRKRARK